MTRKSMTLGAIFVLFAVPAQVTPASAVPEEVRTACLFEAYEVRPRLNAPQIEGYVANCIADFTATYGRRRQR
jgi:hypothetical protein